MARTFVAASLQSLFVNSTPVVAHPFSMSCWFNSVDVSATQILMWLGDKDVTADYWRIMLLGGDLVADAVDGTVARATTTSGYSINTWHHALGVFTSSASRDIFIDGGSIGSNTSVRSPDNADRIAIGVSADSTPGGYMDGLITDVAIWNAALGGDDRAMLAARYSADQVRRESLVFYDDMIRDEDRDIVGGRILTPSGAPTVGDQPRIIYSPTPSFVPALPAASIIRWNKRGGLHLQTDANWGGAVNHHFQADLRATKGTMRARLIKVSDGSEVANSVISTTSSTQVLVRSAALTLTDTENYAAQTGWIPGTDEGFGQTARIVHF